MVVAHATLTHPAEGQIMLTDLPECIVHAHAARHHVLEQVLDTVAPAAEGVEGKRPRSRVDELHRLFEAVVAEHR